MFRNAAATELVKRGWGFHTQQSSWFQRLETAEVKENEYERGTFAWFDHENGWCQRKKADFRFDYCFLQS